MQINKKDHTSVEKKPYYNLLVMTIFSLISMYVLMYAMVNKFDNIYTSINQLYMAALMTATMPLFTLVVMGSMYKIKKWNMIIIIVSILTLVGSFVFIRQQIAINDVQFLRAMISHHSSAILMCEQASIQDPEVLRLCQEIIASQQAEIDQMEAKLHISSGSSPIALLDISTIILILSLGISLIVYLRSKKMLKH